MKSEMALQKDLVREAVQFSQLDNAVPGLQIHGNSRVSLSGTCADAFIPRDGSYTAVSRNDDGSTGPINLGFTFGFCGNTYTQVWINTNGNLTFTGPYGVYTPTGFPISLAMVAPFWADVDTRNTACGQIWYKLLGDHLIVTWDDVGYYSANCSKRNTFQVIIGDGNASLPGPGKNVQFRYADMQFTAGIASGGVGGLGGAPATVGYNVGDNVNFEQVGRFDHAGSDYDGAFGNNDGVDFLDNNCFLYDAGGDDADGDGVISCLDCDDNDDTVYPGAPELCDGLDNDCDGVLPSNEVDDDSDGVTECNGDCDDNDPYNYPGNTEVCDNQDNDCDGDIDEGFDADGDGVTTCNGDCDDNDANNYPGNTEVCDGQDNNCDDVVDEGFTDTDEDGQADCVDPDDDNDGIEDDCDTEPLVNNYIFTGIQNLPASWLCGNNSSKVLVCHIPPGNPSNAQTICISPNAVQTHLNHGDYLGTCTCVAENQITLGSTGSNLFGQIEFEILPNPVNSKASIHLHGLEGEASVHIFDQLGRSVWSQQVEDGQMALELDLTNSTFQNGIYLVSVISKAERMTKRLVIARQ